MNPQDKTKAVQTILGFISAAQDDCSEPTFNEEEKSKIAEAVGLDLDENEWTLEMCEQSNSIPPVFLMLSFPQTMQSLIPILRDQKGL